MRTSEGNLSRACYGKESATITCVWQDSKTNEEWESFIVNKEESLSYALIGGYCYGEVGGGLSRRWAA